MWTLMLATALAGYGDAVDGLPSRSEREVHLWTNAARVAPSEFDEAYRSGGCRFDRFKEQEKIPRAPLAHVAGLNEAARVHSVDMASGGFVSHESSDGTGTFERVDRYYQGYTVGENVAGGYPSAFHVVVPGWMCSSGHRSNILQDGFSELGTGSDGQFYTQVFGASGGETPTLTMGVHTPETPSSEVAFLVSYGGTRPDKVDVVVNGDAWRMDVRWGEAGRGIYAVDVPVGSGCYAYHFEAQTGEGMERFPEEGAYGWGDCDFDDPDAGWFSHDTIAGPRSPYGWAGSLDDKGCSTAPGFSGGLGLLGLLGLRRRRSLPAL